MKNFLIANPIRDGVFRLNYVWNSQVSQTYPIENTGIFYLVNNTTDGTIKFLEQQKNIHSQFKEISWVEKNIPGVPKDTRHPKTRHEYIHPHLVTFFNDCLEYGLKKDYDFVSVFGSDTILDINLVKNIVKHNVDVIAPLLNLNYGNFIKNPRYNLLKGNRTSVDYAAPTWEGLKRLPRDYYVTGLAMKREVIEAGIRFKYDPNRRSGWEFTICDAIRDDGFEIYMDTSIVSRHLKHGSLVKSTPGLREIYIPPEFN